VSHSNRTAPVGAAAKAFSDVD